MYNSYNTIHFYENKKLNPIMLGFNMYDNKPKVTLYKMWHGIFI